MSKKDEGYQLALAHARSSYIRDGGIPIGACLVDQHGKVLGQGHNMRVQKKSPTLHAEIAAFEDAGRLAPSALKGSTMYTTLAPCDMCTGACILFGVEHVVVGENASYPGAIDHLKQKGISVTVLEDTDAQGLMQQFMKEKPDIWNEDIGVE